MRSKLTLIANFDAGEGDVGNLEKWRKNNALLRMDLLQDWLGLIEDEYALAFKDYRVEMAEIKQRGIERRKNEKANRKSK